MSEKIRLEDSLYDRNQLSEYILIEKNRTGARKCAGCNQSLSNSSDPLDEIILRREEEYFFTKKQAKKNAHDKNLRSYHIKASCLSKSNKDLQFRKIKVELKRQLSLAQIRSYKDRGGDLFHLRPLTK